MIGTKMKNNLVILPFPSLTAKFVCGPKRILALCQYKFVRIKN